MGLKNWVLWKSEKRGGKLTKVPYAISGNLASSTDPTTWSEYEQVKKIASTGAYSGIGFVLPLDMKTLAIDLDKCVENGEIKNPIFKEFVEKTNTYTELSPSKKGIHLFFNLTEPLKLQANKSSKCPGFECYTFGRYLTVTELYKTKKEIRLITPDEAIKLLSIAGYPWKEKPIQVHHKTGSLILDDEEITKRMFGSKSGPKIESLWGGDISAYNNDYSSADMALCMHLAFWTQKDAEKMRSLWLSSPLGQREKTISRKDYQDLTISHAIAATTETYSPRSGSEIAKAMELMTNAKGEPFKNAENVKRIISKDNLLSTAFRFNEFNNDTETNLSCETWRQLQTHDIMFVTLHIQKNYSHFESIKRQNVEEAIVVYSLENKVNPIQDFIKKLEWDGIYRIDHWLHHVYGVEENAYHAAVGANWLKGLVRRIIEPGCKFDFLLILEGQQGWLKSTSLAVLGKGYHAETIITPENKDFFLLLGRNAIVEFSEGHTMNRSDTRLLKSVITTTEDQIRVPYGRGITRFPRHCVFAMTTNQNTYLRDETGNRRFLPVEVKNPADIEWLENNLEQLYAEAYERAVIKKETIWEFPEETANIQESKMIENPYEESLINWYGHLTLEERNNGITALQAYQKIWQGGVPLGREMGVFQTMQVTSLFSAILKLRKKQTVIDGQRAMRWYPTIETLKIVGAPQEINMTEVFK